MMYFMRLDIESIPCYCDRGGDFVGLGIATGRLRKLDIQINCYPRCRKPPIVS